MSIHGPLVEGGVPPGGPLMGISPGSDVVCTSPGSGEGPVCAPCWKIQIWLENPDLAQPGLARRGSRTQTFSGESILENELRWFIPATSLAEGVTAPRVKGWRSSDARLGRCSPRGSAPRPRGGIRPSRLRLRGSFPSLRGRNQPPPSVSGPPPPGLQKPAAGAAGPPACPSEDPAARAPPESESNYDPNYELHREGIPYRVYGYQRIPPLIKQVPTKIRRTPVSLGVKSSRSPYKASRNNHLPPRQIKLHTAELHSIREALSQIRAQVDGLLESLQHTGQQRDQSTDEEASISLGGQPIGDGNPSRTISSIGFLFGCPSAAPK
ncbi:uncharacterized protein [Dipodomys merriami]|uniref:uncharacterized protein n=1 Tax=Dipodomys merriami TaxID=94247 RepID=UPI003855975B